jgi:hypothetical protein
MEMVATVVTVVVSFSARMIPIFVTNVLLIDAGQPGQPGDDGGGNGGAGGGKHIF